MKVQKFNNYIISECGRITNSRTGRILKIGKNNKGYSQIQLSAEGRQKTFSLHRLVYTHFKGEIPKNFEVNHIDGNKDNNHISNLELVSRKENMIKAVELGLIKSGSECSHSVPVHQINPLTNEIIATFGSINIATNKTNVAGSGISSVINGNRLSAGGYLWKKARRI